MLLPFFFRRLDSNRQTNCLDPSVHIKASLDYEKVVSNCVLPILSLSPAILLQTPLRVAKTIFFFRKPMGGHKGEDHSYFRQK